LFASPRINELDSSKLRPGDFAVTADGVHTLAFLGGDTWIEADPNRMKVITAQSPNREIVWFDVPVAIVTWKSLVQ
jgi:hypothetical protein